MKEKKVNILGVYFDAITMKEAIKRVVRFLDDNQLHTVYTCNPEIVMEAKKNESFLNLINNGDLVVADGIGVVIGSRIIKHSLPERVAGYDLVQNIFNVIKDTNKTVYFFGAAPGIAKKAVERMKDKYPGLKIVGYHDGYFDQEEEKKIIDELVTLQPDLLLIGLGAPKQEKWVSMHRDQLGVKVCIGVGGSFDVMSGEVKRAPKLFIKLGLEWFYRLVVQPTRIKRMMRLPAFLFHVFINRKAYR